MPLSLSMVVPAAAGDPVLRTTTWSGQYQGQPLACDVEGSSDVDFDDLDPPRALVYYATRMADDDERCAAAIADVIATVTYTATDGTVDFYESNAASPASGATARPAGASSSSGPTRTPTGRSRGRGGFSRS